MIHQRRFEDAKKMKNELSLITIYPNEIDFNSLYRAFEISLFLSENDTVSARKAIEAVRGHAENTTPKNKYMYHYNLGSINFQEKRYADALSNYLIAYGIEDIDRSQEFQINYCIAFSYYQLGMHFKAIFKLKEIYFLYAKAKSNANQMSFFNLLGVNYLRINEIDESKVLLEKALDIAIAIKRDIYIGGCMQNLGHLAIKQGNFEKAMEYFKNAEDYLIEGQDVYCENIYYKILCMILMKDNASEIYISRAMLEYQDNEHYLMLFKCLHHFLFIKNDESAEFVQSKAIPYLIEKYEYSRALEYCKRFKEQMEKSNKKIKTLEIDAIALMIHQKMIGGA